MPRGIILAIAAGTVAGMAIPSAILAVIIIGSSRSISNYLDGISLAVLTIAITFRVVASTALLLGLPITAALKKLGWESEGAYLFVGGLTGFLVPWAIFAVVLGTKEVFLLVFYAGPVGALSGAITGRVWWRQYRAPIVESELLRAEHVT